MKTVILYSSKSGYTRKYAGWLSEELSAEVMDIRKADIQKLAACDLVIFGGSLHAVGAFGLGRLAGEIEQVGHLRLHAVGEFLIGDRAFQVVGRPRFSRDPLGKPAVERAGEIEF